MKTLSGFIDRSSKQAEEKEIREIVRAIRPLVKKTAGQIFHKHTQKLLTEPIDYIVPAVWGAKLNGTLDKTQEEIYRTLDPLFRLCMKSLEFSSLSKAQEFALDYLFKEIMISKLAFLIELARNEALKAICEDYKASERLEGVEIIGNA